MLKAFKVDKLDIKIMDTREEMGMVAGLEASSAIKEILRQKDEVNIIFAAAPSQNEILAQLLEADEIDWNRINAFHMDEYIGLPKSAPQGFGNFLKDRLFGKLPFKTINYIDISAEDPQAECLRYQELLWEKPADIVFMGIGENGHLAFNDPPVADFYDTELVKIVELDQVCRQQQVNDGCFASIADVPTHAITLTIPALISAERVFCVVPAKTKAAAVYKTVRGEVTTECPASILRTTGNATLYCDADSGRDILYRKALITDEVSQDFEIAAELAQKHGYEAVELRSAYDKGPHELDEAQILKIKAIASKYKLKICAISSPVFKCEMDDSNAVEAQYEILTKCAALAKTLGAPVLRAFTFWRKHDLKADLDFITSHIAAAASILAKDGLVLAIENDPSVSASNADELSELFRNLHAKNPEIKNVVVLWDPGNQIFNNPTQSPYPSGYMAIREYMGHVHLKDAIPNSNPASAANAVAIGDGAVDFKGQLAALVRDGYDGFVVLEPHFRVNRTLDEAQLALPGGAEFSDGGFLATELSIAKLETLISKVISNMKSDN